MTTEDTKATRAAREVIDGLCAHPDVWLTHGLPSVGKLALIEQAIARALDSYIASQSPAPAPQDSSVSASPLDLKAERELADMLEDDVALSHAQEVARGLHLPPVAEALSAQAAASIRRLADEVERLRALNLSPSES